MSETDKNTCPVCLEWTDQHLECAHALCNECYNKLTEFSVREDDLPRCPVCKLSIWSTPGFEHMEMGDGETESHMSESSESDSDSDSDYIDEGQGAGASGARLYTRSVTASLHAGSSVRHTVHAVDMTGVEESKEEVEGFYVSVSESAPAAAWEMELTSAPAIAAREALTFPAMSPYFPSGFVPSYLPAPQSSSSAVSVAFPREVIDLTGDE